MKLNRIYTLVALAMVSVSAAAQTSEAVPFVRIGHNAAREAMAGAGIVSDSYAAWAAFENPAAAVFTGSKSSSAASFQSWAPNGFTELSFGEGFKPFDKLIVSVGVNYGLGKEMDMYDESGKKSGTFTPNHMVASLGAGYLITPAISVGANLHYAAEKLTEKVSYGVASADVFVQYNANGLKGALGVSSLGSGVISNKGIVYHLPTSAKLGLGYEGNSGALNFGAYADLDYFIYSGGIGASVGADVCFKDMLSVRAGYHYGNQACLFPSYASFGLGAKFSGITLDVAYLLGGVMSGTLALTLGYAF